MDAVVSTIGGTVTNPKPDSEGNINLIEQAAQSGVKKFVLITSIGTGDSKDAPGEEVYNVLKPVLVEKAKAEQALMVSLFVLCRPRASPLRRGPACMRCRALKCACQAALQQRLCWETRRSCIAKLGQVTAINSCGCTCMQHTTQRRAHETSLRFFAS